MPTLTIQNVQTVSRKYAYPDPTEAACFGMDTNLFYGEDDLVPRVVVETCHRCPITAACLQGALERREYGYWGGTTLTERERIMRRRRPAA